MIPTPGVGVQVLSRHIRLCASDGTQVFLSIPPSALIDAFVFQSFKKNQLLTCSWYKKYFWSIADKGLIYFCHIFVSCSFLNKLSFYSRFWVTSTQWGQPITPRTPRPGASLQRYVSRVFFLVVSLYDWNFAYNPSDSSGGLKLCKNKLAALNLASVSVCVGSRWQVSSLPSWTETVFCAATPHPLISASSSNWESPSYEMLAQTHARWQWEI